MGEDVGNLSEARLVAIETGDDRAVRDFDRRITIALADDLAEPQVRHARCSNMYSYADMDTWHHTPLMAARARLDQ